MTSCVAIQKEVTTLTVITPGRRMPYTDTTWAITQTPTGYWFIKTKTISRKMQDMDDNPNHLFRITDAGGKSTGS